MALRSASTKADSLERCVRRNRGIDLRLNAIGPVFRCSARDVSQRHELASLAGFIAPPLLHFDIARINRAATKSSSTAAPLFGFSALLALRSALWAQRFLCSKGECLAVDDNPTAHARLLRLYTRLGFVEQYYVGERGLADIPDLVVWGARGTRCGVVLFSEHPSS